MDLEKAEAQYKKNIMKLAERSKVDYDVMLENWVQKFNEFEKITDNSGFSDELENYSLDNTLPMVALTINGTILIISEPDENNERKVRYQSIKIRTDDSKNIPEIFTSKIQNDVMKGKSVVFEKILETSAIIQIRTSDELDWDTFENVADAMTMEFTRQFELIDNETITRQIIDMEE